MVSRTLEAKYFDIELKNTSTESGITINYPVKNFSSMPLPDMGLLASDGATVTADGQSAKLQCDDGRSGAIQLGSYDGGGYTTLVVEAVLEGGIRIRGHSEKPEGPTNILIPKHQEGSRIASSWLKENGNPGEDDDLESSPGNENAGDGLNAYEEYRGVWSHGKFKRLSPKKKELGVAVQTNDKALFASGIAMLSAAAGIEVTVLNEDELDGERIFNINSLTSGHTQYALRLYNVSCDGAHGENIPLALHNKTPKLSDSVKIDVVAIRSDWANQDAAAKRGNKSLPYSAEEDIASTTAHELAHGIHVDHHGRPSTEMYNYEAYAGSAVSCKIYDPDGNLITERPFTMRGKTASSYCEESGDLNCFMVYNSYYQWAFKNEDGTLVYRAVPFIAPGKRLCTDPNGTGINANGFFGNASAGNCLSQVKIRDK